MFHTILQSFFLIFLLSTCKSKIEKTKPKEEDITESVYASGIIKSKDQYKVFSSVSGLIDKVLLTNGELVKKGDVIIQLVNTTPKINIENAKLSSKYASFDSNSEKLNELKIRIYLAKTKMENDSILLDKQNLLWVQGIGSHNDLLNKELIFKTSANSAFKLGKFSNEEVESRAMEKLKMLGIDGLALRLSSQISGGEKQRVAIARALINDPQIIMGDEPTGNLDNKNGEIVFDIFKKLAEEFNQTLLIVTHDLSFAKRTHRQIKMEDGKIIM